MQIKDLPSVEDRQAAFELALGTTFPLCTYLELLNKVNEEDIFGLPSLTYIMESDEVFKQLRSIVCDPQS